MARHPQYSLSSNRGGWVWTASMAMCRFLDACICGEQPSEHKSWFSFLPSLAAATLVLGG